MRAHRLQRVGPSLRRGRLTVAVASPLSPSREALTVRLSLFLFLPGVARHISWLASLVLSPQEPLTVCCCHYLYNLTTFTYILVVLFLKI